MLRFAFCLVSCFCCVLLFSQKKSKKVSTATIAFYNVENLYDTLDEADATYRHLPYESPEHRKSVPFVLGKTASTDSIFYHNTRDEDFTPQGSYRWNGERYEHKLRQLASVLSDIAKDKTKQTPDVIGLAEIENRLVLEDLVKQPKLNESNYGILHFNSPDERGIDVALLYKKSRFLPLRSAPIEVHLRGDNGKRDFTRDILMVKGLLDGEPFYFFVNHFPSRRGGEKRSRPLRNAVAHLCRTYVDSIASAEPHTKVILMGDFNDDPTNESIASILFSQGKEALEAWTPEEENEENNTLPAKPTPTYPLFNPFADLFKKGVGTLAYQDGWNLFDQMILSPNLLDAPSKDYRWVLSGVFNLPFLLQKSGNFKNYPWRTYVGNTYAGGYSDHFPVYTILARER